MKAFIVTLFVSIAAAAQLQNTYLPPHSAASAGGQGSFLQGPTSSGASGNFLSPRTTFNNAGQPHSFQQGTQSGFGSLGGGAFSGQPTQGTGFKGAHHTPSGPQIPILSYNNINNGDGSYHFDYATGNGIQQNEDGHLNHAGAGEGEQVVQGSYSYTGDDGQTYAVHYKADSNGFQPIGDHLPTPPPIPEAILKSLEYNAAHPEENDGGSYNAGIHGGSSFGANGGRSYGGGKGTGSPFGAGTGQRDNFKAPVSGRPQQQYLPPQHQSGGLGGNAGYHY